MRILVYPHDLGIGGSQLNAVELAAAVRDRGHEVLVHGTPGPLVDRVQRLGLEFVPAPPIGRRPSPGAVAALARLARERELDVLHGYEWPPGLECHLASMGSPATAVTTVMSMAVAPFLPRSSPVVVGTSQIAAHERSRGRRRTALLEPPVDTGLNRPGIPLDVDGFRSRWGLDDRPTVVCVTRLAHQLKLEGVLTAISAMPEVTRATSARLLLVGGGDAWAEVSARAAEVNLRAGAGTVVLTGELDDPRPAYALADVALGMGGSALRAMAFGTPLVVLGEGGFVETLTEETLPGFLWRGWYGYGGDGDPGSRMAEELVSLLHDPARRSELGRLGRSTVERRFSLEAVAGRQEQIYAEAVAEPTGVRAAAAAGARSLVGYAHHQAARRAARLVGRPVTEDFNGRPVARATATGSQALGRADRPVSQGEVVLWFAGVPWDAVNGTDRHLATALSEHGLVVWVDPPTSWTSRPRRGLEIPAVSRPRPGVVRVSTSCPPGVSRPGSRRLARWLVTAHAARVVRSLGGGVATVVVSDPQQHVPRRSGAAVRVYFETDDFVAGAGLLGHSTRYALRCRRVNLRRSDVVLAVTDHLRARLEQEPDAPTVVVTLANGADTHHYRDVDAVAVAAEVALARPMAGLIGQLNDRLDLDALDAVAGTGSRLLLLGPRYDSRPETRARLDALIARPNVQWVDRQPFERLPEFMAALDVGLTPYAVTDFNRGSHPLKTLEYLAAGRGAISTDLPAARALGTDLVTVTGSAAEFAAATVEHLAAPPDPRLVAARRDFAGTHSWQVRAKQLLGICDEVRARRRDGEER